MGYSLINLNDMLDVMGEEETKSILSSYLCPINKDIEYFLHDKSIEFAKQGIAATHLVFTSYKNETVLIGYFALANKYIFISKKLISKTYQRRARKFGTSHESGFTITAPLIAQLGKNFTNSYNRLITGDELLKLALDKVKDIQSNIGGRFVYVECEDVTKLIEFYSSNGFFHIGRRDLDSDEKGLLKGTYLIQMMRYIHV